MYYLQGAPVILVMVCVFTPRRLDYMSAWAMALMSFPISKENEEARLLHVIFVFCATSVVRNTQITEGIPSRGMYLCLQKRSEQLRQQYWLAEINILEPGPSVVDHPLFGVLGVYL